MKRILFFIALIALFTQCKDDEIDPKESFTKIYDSFRSDHNYYPIDIVALDTGYIILAGETLDNSQFMGAQIIRLDEYGNYAADQALPDNYVLPTGELMKIGDNVYFLVMENIASRPARLIEVYDMDSLNYNPAITVGGGVTNPLASYKTENDEILILSFNAGSNQTVLSLHDSQGNLQQSAGYDIGAGAEFEDITDVDIYDHYLDPERSGLPFFCGQIPGGSYYFNGVYGYTLSWVFTNFGSPTGVVQGQQANGGMTAVLPISGNTFSIFGYQYNDNFVRPTQTVETTNISSSIDYMGLPVSEFRSRTNAKIISLTLGTTTYSVVAAETESRQIALYFYDSTTGELDAIHKIGYLNPYELSSIKLDEENNLMVLGTTLVSGRFPRIFVSKIPEKELMGIVGL